ncbi:MAG: N-6 DNA methylase [Actinobacteria bacterium]|nr:N-6 DNA methylase [Actinomycetota bacterium]MBU1495058.1 N-6 DNA methylase [Actinomycetota bacterium]MBU1865222.1 N-6 DNA methylase [Actinomycetota bacterium]
MSQLTLLPTDGVLIEARDSQSNHGEVFTRRWIVEFILDLVGYRAEEDLASLTVVEPACGSGAFLIPIVDRLVASAQLHKRDLAAAAGAIRAYDVLEQHAEAARMAVADRLGGHGFPAEESEKLANRWVTTSDFLLHDHVTSTADFVVGNPPYIRLEDVPRPLTDAYRRACPTMQGRSDIYVGFIEMGLRLLRSDGKLGYICADRWMRNQYGGALRQLITSSYAVETVVGMHDVDAFEEEVSAYPAIVVLRNSSQNAVNTIDAHEEFGPEDAVATSKWVDERTPTMKRVAAQGARLTTWFQGKPSWPAGNPARQALVADLESRFPPLENRTTGTRVGIGVATGCDEVYITADSEVVEPDRLLPLLLARDTVDGKADWSGHYLVNPWNGDGLVDLMAYPRLKEYFEANAERIRRRHVARKRPQSWYRTIDRVDPALRTREKLVLPDMKAQANPVLDRGESYPHHNLYFVVSEAWDLEVLGALLLSDVANALIGAYCVKMRGGTYRFQAQYIRRMRVPDPAGIDGRTRRQLAGAFRARDREAATELTAGVYGVDRSLLNAAVRR